MKISVVRDVFMKDRTLGELLVDGRHFCYTLEDVVRPAGSAKVPGKTAIPAGTYDVKITYSNRFKKNMIQIMNVPGFDGIRIHGGNKPEDTEGCILAAYSRDVKSGIIWKRASDDLQAMVAKAKDCTITVSERRK